MSSSLKVVLLHSLIDFAALLESMHQLSRLLELVQAQSLLTTRLHQVLMSQCLLSRSRQDKPNNLLLVLSTLVLQFLMLVLVLKVLSQTVSQLPQDSQAKLLLLLVQIRDLSFSSTGSSHSSGKLPKLPLLTYQLISDTTSLVKVLSGCGRTLLRKLRIWQSRKELIRHTMLMFQTLL